MQALSLSNGRIFLCGEQESKGPVQLLSIRQCLAPTLESGAKVERCQLQYIQIPYIKNSLKYYKRCGFYCHQLFQEL